MRQAGHRTSRPLSSFLLGLIGTLLVVVAHQVGIDQRAELHALDLRFEYLSRLAVPRNILHVDIDDHSLAELGRWPWPREVVAGIIGVLSDCGARTVALDIIMPEPQRVRYRDPAGEVYGSGPASIIGKGGPVPVFDDAILARTIARVGNVAMPMHIGFETEGPSALQTMAERAMGEDLTLSVRELAERLQAPVDRVEAVYRRAKETAINAAVARVLAEGPTAAFHEVLKAVLPDLPTDTATDEGDTAERAYLRLRALEAIERFSIDKRHIAGHPLRTGVLIPPLVTLAQQVHASGFVTVVPDVDGVVRRIPMLAGHRRHTYLQFALALAAEALDRDHGGGHTVSADADSVTITCKDGFRRVIPVARDGMMLVSWVPGSQLARGRERGMLHIPAAAVAAAWQAKAKLRRHRDLAHGLRIQFLSCGAAVPDERLEALYFQLSEGTDKLDAIYGKRVRAEVEMQRALVYRPGDLPDPRELAQLRDEEGRIQAAVSAAAETLVTELRKPVHFDAFLGKPAAASQPGAATNAESREDLATYRANRGKALDALRMLDRLAPENAAIEAELHKLTGQLRPIVGNRTCLVGSTSTGAADFVPTPLGPRTPGVAVHANILNTILSGEFIRPAGPILDLAAIVAFGVLVSLVAATRPVFHAGPLAVGLAVAYVAFNGFAAFQMWNMHLTLVAPLVAMLASFVLVTAYRQLTEERAKRQIRDLFSHALSPTLVNRLLEDPSLLQLGGEERTLSLMFSDLAGFTTISERLGPQETVRLLNRYFDGVTDVIQNRQGGCLNKFLGDGIFAFFGAPVFQEDHALRAVRAALDCQARVDELNATTRAELGGDVELSVRIGITTGAAMVGNCGATDRLDYTAIGDRVNLASRLEAANKFFGSHILVDEPTHRAAVEADMLTRPLGLVYVTGRNEPLWIWEVLGAADARSTETRQAVARFSRALDLLKRRRFADAAEALKKVAGVLPDDEATRIYLDLCREGIALPPERDLEPEPTNAKGVSRIAWPWD